SGYVFGTIIAVAAGLMIAAPWLFDSTYEWSVRKHAAKSATEAEVENALRSDSAFDRVAVDIQKRKWLSIEVSGEMTSRFSLRRLITKLQTCPTLYGNRLWFDLQFDDNSEPFNESVEMNEIPPTPSVSLIVLRVSDLSRSAEFYARLGVHFESEQHGDGPEHFAAQLGHTVFELYPATGKWPVSTSVRLGFRVNGIDATVDQLRRSDVTILTEPQASSWGRRAVVVDPDGHRIELTSNGP
ncbi:MAG: VOC family protein, partial [Planctomycetaceae bacterium]